MPSYYLCSDYFPVYVDVTLFYKAAQTHFSLYYPLTKKEDFTHRVMSFQQLLYSRHLQDNRQPYIGFAEEEDTGKFKIIALYCCNAYEERDELVATIIFGGKEHSFFSRKKLLKMCHQIWIQHSEGVEKKFRVDIFNAATGAKTIYRQKSKEEHHLRYFDCPPSSSSSSLASSIVSNLRNSSISSSLVSCMFSSNSGSLTSSISSELVPTPSRRNISDESVTSESSDSGSDSLTKERSERSSAGILLDGIVTTVSKMTQRQQNGSLTDPIDIFRGINKI